MPRGIKCWKQVFIQPKILLDISSYIEEISVIITDIKKSSLIGLVKKYTP